MKTLLYGLILAGSLLTTTTRAQPYPHDIVVMRENKIPLLADIVEVGESRFTFRLPDLFPDSVFAVDLSRVTALLFKDGKAVVTGPRVNHQYWQRTRVWNAFYDRAGKRDPHFIEALQLADDQLLSGFRKYTGDYRLGFSLGPALMGTGGILLLGAAISEALGSGNSDTLLGVALLSAGAGIALIITGHDSKNKAKAIRKALFLRNSGVPVRSYRAGTGGNRVGMLTLQFTF